MKTIQENIEEYKQFLFKTHSPITVKNYISDIYHFVNWFASYYSTPFEVELLTKTSISEYKRLRGGSRQANISSLSEQSIQRHLSSLRSFCAYLTEFELLSENPFDALLQDAQAPSNAWKLEVFKEYLLKKQSSDLTIKYYINDIKNFMQWAHEVLQITEEIKNPNEVITEEIILEYRRRLTHVLLLSPLSINRKLSSIRNYLSFLKVEIEKNKIPNISPSNQQLSGFSLHDLTTEEKTHEYSRNRFIKNAQKAKNAYLSMEEKTAQFIAGTIISKGASQAFQPKDYDKRIQNIDEVLNTLKYKNVNKEFYSAQASPAGASTHKKIWHHIRHTRPKWYKEYHTYPFVHYVHFGVLVGAAVIAGFFVYNNTLGKANADLALQKLKPATKILSFKGKVLTKDGLPVNTPTNVTFGLYTSPTDGNSSLIWRETQENIKPDENGSISLIVGSKTPIPNSLSESEIPLFLGVTIGDQDELLPRKPIGSAFAANTETVQGMLPITSSDEQRNVLLALDGSGNLAIGGVSNPTFQATGGSFTFSGETLILATNPSSNGTIQILPDGNGKIEVGKAIFTRNLGAHFGFENVVEIEGGLGVISTSSAHATLMLSQNSRGDLISASTSGLTKFAVDNQGTIIKGAWAGDFIPTQYGGLGANVTSAGSGEILYSLSPTKYTTLKSGVKGQCLTIGGVNTPAWGACGGLTQLNGSLFTSNSTLDLLIGGSSTTSAKFAFINMNSGTPTLRVGSALGIDTNGIIQAYNSRDLTLGGNETKNILLASSGNVGIGTSNPTRTLDVNGTFGGKTELYIDGEGTRTVTISEKALIYDLEKTSGGTDTDGTTTYNITGLPDVDGTIAYLYLKASKGLTTNPRTQTVTVQINGTYIASTSTPNNWTLADEGIKHITVLRSNNTWHVQGDPGINNTADLAEWTTYEGKKPQFGEIVSIAPSGKLTTSQKAYDNRLAGVISTKPNITIGPLTHDSVRLALSGRIPTIVTTVSGPITSGDMITSSDIPGVGMKPQRNSPVIGKALSSFPDIATCAEVGSIDEISWPEDDGTNKANPCFKVPSESFSSEISNKLLTKYGITSSDFIYIGKVMVLANLSWSQEDDFLASTEGITITTDDSDIKDPSLFSLMDSLQNTTYATKVGGKIKRNIGTFSNVFSAQIQTGILTTKNAVITGTLAAYNIVGNTITAAQADIETLTAGSITSETITSPLARVNTIQTDTIEPLSKDVQVKLSSPSSQFSITNADNTAVSSFDAAGNATFSGELASNNLTTNDASISGTLRAKKLIAEDIEGLSDQVSSFANKFLDDYETTASIPSYQLGDSLLTASVSASFGTFHHGLISLGASTFGSLTAIDQISIGTDFVLSEGGINTLGKKLELQPLRQGAISLMAGSVTIETDGKLIVSENAVFAKNVSIEGTLFANTISAQPGKNLSIQLQNSNFAVQNATNSAVFEINPTGDVSASGSGTFSKLNFQLVAEALAANDLEAYATTSAGTATLKAYRPELTIHNNNVTEKSLIYITPSNNTDNQVLYLLRQVPNSSFTVGVSQVVDHDVTFNWLIVN